MRKARDVVAHWPHHLIHRGNNRRRLFSYPRDYQRFLVVLSNAADKSKCVIHALCLMANHVHLLVTPPTARALSSFAHSFAQRYAQFRNAQRNSSGKLFEERYWSEPIRSQFHLGAATMYIDRNPVAAGTKSDPSKYRWSTFRHHAGLATPERTLGRLWQPSQWYLDLGRTPAVRATEYRSLYERYGESDLARRQQERFCALEKSDTSRRRLERPDRSSAR